MANAHGSTDQALEEGAFVPATLVSVRPCPARADYIELRFDTPEGEWDWCFAEPTERDLEPVRVPLALVLGRYGTQAHLVVDDALGPALPSTSALPTILCGADVRIARRLVLAGR
jgi:hypothetical protein